MPRADKLDLKSAYSQWVAVAQRQKGKEGFSSAIGGEFEAFGVIQTDLLRSYGLKAGDFVIDVGCGSGRLAIPLSRVHDGRYLGLDIVDSLVDFARGAVAASGFEFAAVGGFNIPAPDGSADVVCFFSVFTHLLHEQSFLYLGEACRVLKAGGKVVISFLEFSMDFQWNIFAATVDDERSGGTHPLNMFTVRVALRKWAEKLGLQVEEFRDGDEAFVPLSRPVTLEDGRRMERFGNLGQSICVLIKGAGTASEAWPG